MLVGDQLSILVGSTNRRHRFLILHNLSIPLILGSYWACAPAALSVALIVWRTVREDRTLGEELPGYEEYTCQTRYRLLPGVS